eukprot:CAMPEP_0173107490 /NCGR_PEP_ID=MMETSP1102-20130122/41849_1 /TAXON_ID=49646 /ORGANISM="Geminigera sp., Strain Caron Lab Isolate" /LENGTH=82 /DNA_ID=CAMNT_0014005171 /DNA_START=110 /DNA_END=355 /DNA_ORIENTATION=+
MDVERAKSASLGFVGGGVAEGERAKSASLGVVGGGVAEGEREKSASVGIGSGGGVRAGKHLCVSIPRQHTEESIAPACAQAS